MFNLAKAKEDDNVLSIQCTICKDKVSGGRKASMIKFGEIGKELTNSLPSYRLEQVICKYCAFYILLELFREIVKDKDMLHTLVDSKLKIIYNKRGKAKL